MEKPKGDGAMINGGFFVLSPKVIDYITDDQTIWEREPLERLAKREIWRPFITTVSGSRWIPCATRCISKNCGNPAMRRGRYGRESGFWKGKRVLLTGHTGFKGSWMSLWLQSMGAEVVVMRWPPPTIQACSKLPKWGRA